MNFSFRAPAGVLAKNQWIPDIPGRAHKHEGERRENGHGTGGKNKWKQNKKKQRKTEEKRSTEKEDAMKTRKGRKRKQMRTDGGGNEEPAQSAGEEESDVWRLW